MSSDFGAIIMKDFKPIVIADNTITITLTPGEAYRFVQVQLTTDILNSDRLDMAKLARILQLLTALNVKKLDGLPRDLGVHHSVQALDGDLELRGSFELSEGQSNVGVEVLGEIMVGIIKYLSKEKDIIKETKSFGSTITRGTTER